MKICILGNVENTWQKTYSWFCKTTWQGLELLGHNVLALKYKENTIQSIEKNLFRFEPDILFTHLTFHNWHDTMTIMGIFENLREYVGTKIIHSMQDARHEPRYFNDISYAFDMALIGQTHNIKKFTKYWNIPVHFFPYCSLTFDKMPEYDKKFDFGKPVFTGNPTAHEDRSNFLNQLGAHIPIYIKQRKAGDTKQNFASIGRSSPCIIAACTGYDIKHYTDCRFWQYGGVGSLLVGRRFKDMDDLIPRNLYIGFDSYNNIPKVVSLIQENINKDNIEMRKNIFNFMQKYHSSVIRMENTINLILEKQDTVKAFLKEF